MNITTIGRALLLSLAAAPAATAQCHDLLGITQIGDQLLQQAPQFGSSCVRIEQHGQIAYQRSFGSFTPQTVVPIASATKTLSAAVLLALVDQGVLSLDDRVSQYLPEWDVGWKRLITLRHCFTHASGLPATSPIIGDNTLTLRQAAQQLVNEPLQHLPGTHFEYGGVSMHIAGAVCEVAAGQSWGALFQQHVAGPLGMTSTDYFGFGPTANPRIAGGARSNLVDFARFVAMLRNGGVHQGVAVLSAASVDQMLSDQTSTLTVVATPHPDQAPYGVGIWLDRVGGDGGTLLARAAGAFGFQGWVDRAHDSSGVFAIQYLGTQVAPFTEQVLAVVDDALLPAGVACVGASSPPCAGDAWLNGSVPARAGATDFEVLASQLPAGALGGVWLADGFTGGAPVLDLVSYLNPTATFVDALVADAHGRARVAAPLGPALLGQTFALQSVWATGDACAQLGLLASHALAITVQ
ncbi:MAG: beta-lactamase family protein [Planctomycetes bacterium]|nr:beta-lactamase family protein [Planctomycetota bacterium]